ALCCISQTVTVRRSDPDPPGIRPQPARRVADTQRRASGRGLTEGPVLSDGTGSGPGVGGRAVLGRVPASCYGSMLTVKAGGYSAAVSRSAAPWGTVE